MTNLFKRYIYDKMVEWKIGSNGKTALLIEGARRIGKTTIVKAFAINEYKSYILIDFAFAPKIVYNLFDDVSNLDFLFLQLQLHYAIDLHERESLIIFDEVQFCPKARQAIKKLVADGRYDYVETGSLISIHKHVKDILIPSEERRITMHPMSFEEFLWATGDVVTMTLLKKAFNAGRALGVETNRHIMRKFRLYMLIGGMPQAVSNYLENNNLKYVDQTKRDILSLYKEDFYKIDPTGKVSHLFEAIPSELNRHSSRYQVSSVFPNHRVTTLAEEFSELIGSKTVLASYFSTDPNTGLAAHKDNSRFRLYLSDTGLLITLMFLNKDFTDNIIYTKLLNDKLPVNLGIVYENVVAQMLAVSGHKLYYHTFYNEKNKKNYEVDFLISYKNKICPIEVKSSGYKVHTSLDLFSEKFSGRIAQKYVIYTRDYSKTADIAYLPIYYTPFL